MVSLLVFSSCGGGDDPDDPITPVTPDPGGNNGEDKPEQPTVEYGTLKSYIDRTKHPDFKFGVAMAAWEFTSSGDMRSIALDNFDNMTAGNEMKYGSIVRDNGSMDFTTVKNLISNAKAAGFGIYGHNLAWHSQQNVTYLSGLLGDVAVEGSSESTTSLIKNPDCEGSDLSSYLMKVDRGTFQAPEVVAPGADGTGHALRVPATAKVEENWDNQFFITSEHTFVKGEHYTLTMKIKADKAATVDMNAHGAPGSYIHYAIGGNQMTFTTEWKDFKFEGTIESEAAGTKTIAWNLNAFAEANNYYFDNIQWTVTTQYSGTRPQTPQEKSDTLVYAMDRWISAAMEACGGYVTDWDVVNEAISGSGDDGSGNYALQHGSDANNFFWQDYMGDELYVRKAVELARKYFAQYGGDPAKLKLFVNDYNLEGDWDNNKKCTSLVNWVKKWEADGLTVIDGIGTQMHVSCSTNPTIQASREKAVENMFKILAASGKLIKITELDVGITDNSGKAIMTTAASEANLKAIAEYYKFIINKYFEIIPKAQQFGITVWSPIDSPKDSYWRAGEPIGLWDQHYKRKVSYDAVADALKANLQ